MPVTASDVNDAYLESVTALRSVMLSDNATNDEKNAAQDSLRDITTMHGMYNIQQVEGRTAMLKSLIVELEQVIDNASYNPINTAMQALDQHIQKARDLYSQAKADLST